MSNRRSYAHRITRARCNHDTCACVRRCTTTYTRCIVQCMLGARCMERARHACIRYLDLYNMQPVSVAVCPMTYVRHAAVSCQNTLALHTCMYTELAAIGTIDKLIRIEPMRALTAKA